MRKPTKQHHKDYANSLKALQKVIELCQKSGIYFYAAHVHCTSELDAEPSILIEQNGVDLSTVFDVLFEQQNDTLHYVYVNVDGIKVRLTI